MSHVSTDHALVTSETLDTFTYRLTRHGYVDPSDVVVTTLTYDPVAMRYVLEDGSDYATRTDAMLRFAREVA